MKKLLEKLKFEYNSIRNKISFFLAKREANRMHELTGKRYHVVPKSQTSLMVVDNTYIDHYNRAMKRKAKKITIEMLLKMSYYSTPVENLTRKIKKK